MKMFDVLVTIGIFVYLTFLQVPHTANIITSSTLFFSVSYLLIRKTRIFHPPCNTLAAHIEAEWRSRIVGTAHAIILTIGSIFCFVEWKQFQLQPGHAWHVPTSDIPSLVKEGHYIVVPLASFFLGYMQYDFLWMLLHKEKNFDRGMMIHHGLFIAITHYVLHGYFLVKTFAWLGFCEVSTPFLHLRWFWAVIGKKDELLYFIWATMFTITFVLARVVGFGWGLMDLWNAREYWVHLPMGLHIVIAGLHVAYVLNIAWGVMVISSFVRNVQKKKKNVQKSD